MNILKEKNLDFSSTTTSEINDDSGNIIDLLWIIFEFFSFLLNYFYKEEKISNKDDFNTDLDESNETADDESEENSNDLLKYFYDINKFI